MASNINKENSWLSSLTQNGLTIYDEGLTCKNFDQGIIFNVKRYFSNTFILKKGAGMKSPSFDQTQNLYYDRMCTVSTDCE